MIATPLIATHAIRTGARGRIDDPNVEHHNPCAAIVDRRHKNKLTPTTHCGIIVSGSKQTKSEAFYLYVNEVFSCPKFMVLDVGNHHPQGRGHRFGDVLKPHVHPFDLSSQRMVFVTPEGAETMTIASSKTTPILGNLETVLRAILAEVTPGQRPYSGDSYLPSHLIEAAQAVLSGIDHTAHQHAHNALSTAAWHVARGEAPQALSRLRRAQSHIMASMEVGAA